MLSPTMWVMWGGWSDNMRHVGLSKNEALIAYNLRNISETVVWVE